ncbi:MAG: TIGR00725 family protein [Planctomycetota bacterium]|nr:TIGR00725 family protein [Planctomycetota bacterium]
MPKYVIAVIGASDASEEELSAAEQIGEIVAQAGCILVCGGLGGVMEAAARGAKKNNGFVVGILPSRRKSDANPFVDFALPTGMNEARNFLVVAGADAAIAVGGGLGTLSEIALALKLGIPVISLFSWRLEENRLSGVEYIEAKDAQDAVKKALKAIEKGATRWA